MTVIGRGVAGTTGQPTTPNAQVVVQVHWDALRQQLTGTGTTLLGDTLAPQTVRRLACRDRGCRYPGCTVPATWCDAHHVANWSRGGPSDLANYALLCPRHHTRVHDRDLSATITTTGLRWHLR